MRLRDRPIISRDHMSCEVVIELPIIAIVIFYKTHHFIRREQDYTYICFNIGLDILLPQLQLEFFLAYFRLDFLKFLAQFSPTPLPAHPLDLLCFWVYFGGYEFVSLKHPRDV